jgi:hypothetical protein
MFATVVKNNVVSNVNNKRSRAEALTVEIVIPRI